MMKWKNFSPKLETITARTRDSYVNFLLKYSSYVIAFIMLVSLCLSAYSILFYYDTFTFNPVIGFETRGTFLSNQRLALDNLFDIAAGNDHIKSRNKREIIHNETLQGDNQFTENNNIWNSEAELELAPGACQQYFVLGTVIPYETILFMSKLIFKASSFNNLFSKGTMERLCAIDSIVDDEISLNGLNGTSLKRLPFSFNLPYYTMCLDMDTPSNSCSLLNLDYINMFKSLVLTCIEPSPDPPVQCQVPIAKQLSNMIFQKIESPVDAEQPFYFSVILPILQSSDGYSDLAFYSSLLEKLQEVYKGDDLKLMGAQFGVKAGLFVQELQGDVRLGVIAVILVILIILLYTDSLFFTFCISASLLLSIGVAFFVYTVIFGVKFFPFLNLLAMVLVVAVGADDAFLFMYQYRKHKEDACKKWSPVLLNCDLNSTKDSSSDKDELMEYHRRNVTSGLSDALSHAAVAMFVTSATTAVAFFANFVSDIMVLRCFGIYASTLMIINYILMITILPAAIIVSDAEIKSFTMSRSFISGFKSWVSIFWNAAAYSFESLFSRLIPQIVHIIRLPLILLSMMTFILSIYAIVKTPGIRLPERNSMQFLRSNHPYEWFDDNAAALFDFSNGQEPKINVIAVWGIKPTECGSSLIPSNIGSLNVDAGFSNVLANHLLDFQELLKNITHQSNPTENTKLWLDDFIEWTKSNGTSRNCELLDIKQSRTPHLEAIPGDMLSRCFLIYGHQASLPVFDDLQQISSDGPIFDRNGIFLGYFVLARTTYNFSTIFKEMKPFFDFTDNVRNMIGKVETPQFNHPLVLTTRRVTKLYDLLERILNGTATSVFISLMVSMVVIVFITFNVIISILAIICIATVVTITIATVLWLGWTVNVVEATIIVLTIGMSFDYCLHFAVGFQFHGTDDYSTVASAVGIPVFLAAISSFLSGLILIGASTQAFYEISVFLMLITITSFTIAVFVFPSMVTLLLQYRSLRTTITRF